MSCLRNTTAPRGYFVSALAVAAGPLFAALTSSRIFVRRSTARFRFFWYRALSPFFADI